MEKLRNKPRTGSELLWDPELAGTSKTTANCATGGCTIFYSMEKVVVCWLVLVLNEVGGRKAVVRIREAYNPSLD